MLTFETIAEAREGIMDFRAEHFDGVPLNARKRFKELSASPSPVDQITGLGEFIWANREVFDDDAKGLAAGLVAFATTNAWHGMLENDRGNAIVANLRKDMGEITRAPAPPEPRPGYVLAPPPTTLEVADDVTESPAQGE